MKFLGVFALLSFTGAVALPPSQSQGGATSCAEMSGASIWGGVGWNHVVALTNRCGRTIACTITTNVDPDARHATIENNITVQVMTAANSPERVFVPQLSCDFISM